MLSIRTYRADDDRKALRDCIVELKDYERSLEPRLPAGEAMADGYIEFLLSRRDECDGSILMAVVDGDVAGFVCVLVRVQPAEPDEGPIEYAYVSDLIVRARHRGHGLGRTLLREAESLARSRGASDLRVGVLAGNRMARALYASAEFSEYQVQLAKSI